MWNYLTSFCLSSIPQENAHFCISEAIIAAVEQIKVKQVCKSPSDHESDDDENLSDCEDMTRGKQREGNEQDWQP